VPTPSPSQPISHHGDPTLEQTRSYFTDFRTEFLSGWQLDDQSQPVPSPSRTTNLDCGSIAERLFDGLKREKDAIESELGMTVLWQDEGDGKYTIAARKPVPDVTAPEQRLDIIGWLRDTTNRFVNVPGA